MTVQEFADRHLAPYKRKGEEIVPERCPFCHGGEHGDKYTFAMNAETGAYNCKRGSCGAQGAFTELLRHFGEQTTQGDEKRRKTAYKRPQGHIGNITVLGLRYLKQRGISQETAKAYRVGEDGKGNLVFPFFDDTMQHVFTKYRPARDIKPGERKSWRDKDTKPILYGIPLCDPAYPLCIFEGEIDAMSGYEAGLPNCVSVPSGAQDFSWLDTCWAFLERFKDIYLFGDNDEPGQAMQRAIIEKLVGWNVYTVPHECKDANELLAAKGKEAVAKAYRNAQEAPVYGILSIRNIEAYDPGGAPRVMSGIPTLDKMLGGFQYGDLTVWTGRRGEGKSTMLNIIALEAIEQGEKVCYYSGELSAQRLLYWLELAAAGRENVKKGFDRKNSRDFYYVPHHIRGMIRRWMDERLFVYDNTLPGAGGADSLLKAFHAVKSRKDCRVFILDNLMTVTLAQTRSGYFQEQSAFVGRLVEFAAGRNAVVHLVAHPRKVSGEITGDDIAGTGDIANRAANVLTLERVNEEEAAAFDVAIRVIKNRWEGITGIVGLDYDKIDRRLYPPSAGNTKKYSWEGMQIGIDIPGEWPRD